MTTTTAAKTNTPGFNCHLHITFSTDSAGRTIATYRSPRNFRTIRVSAEAARQWIAQGLATEAGR
jgi:hypothetical protein